MLLVKLKGELLNIPPLLCGITVSKPATQDFNYNIPLI